MEIILVGGGEAKNQATRHMAPKTNALHLTTIDNHGTKPNKTVGAKNKNNRA